MVSNMSWMSRRSSSVMAATGVVACRRIGSPRTRMSRMLTVPRSRLGRGGARAHADDPRDPSAFDDQPGLGGLDRDVIFHGARLAALVRHRLSHVDHLAHDAAEGDDLITALDVPQRLLVLLLLRLLRADEQEVEDAED